MTKEKIRDMLLRYAAKRRWAFEDLVYDERMKEANRLYGASRREQKAYLAGRGVDWSVVKKLPDGFSDLISDEKEKEAVALFDSLRLMVRYLVVCYGSREALIKELRHLVAVQADRRKTCHLHPTTRQKK